MSKLDSPRLNCGLNGLTCSPKAEASSSALPVRVSQQHLQRTTGAKDVGREVGPTEKPSAGIQQSSFTASKTRRKEVARPATINDRDDDNRQHARDERLD